MEIEAVVLTGGASRRMGEDKASLLIEGVPLAERIVSTLLAAGLPVTVLGRSPVQRAAFIEDAKDYAGPLSALAAFAPSAEFVQVLSCDLPLFDPGIVSLLRGEIGEMDAAVPVVGGYRQPLAAMYRASAFDIVSAILESGRQSMMAWLGALKSVEVLEDRLRADGIDPRSLTGVNTPQELASLG